MAGAPIRELLFVEALGMRGCQSPGAGRCITAPGKVSGSRRFYVIILVPLGAVAPTTADAPKQTSAIILTIEDVGAVVMLFRPSPAVGRTITALDAADFGTEAANSPSPRV
jgi:hypothetical protein